MQKITIYSPCKGKIVDLENVKDDVFSQKMMGDGVAIEPLDEEFCAIVDGNLEQIFRTNHAYTILEKNSAELLVHIGIDTVQLKGEGFTPLQTSNSAVKLGTPIIKANLDFIKTKKDTTTIILLTNIDDFKEFKVLVKEGDIVAPKQPIFEFYIG